MRWMFLTFLLPAGPAIAQSDAACEELWFARNAMANSAGYCFSSPLGQTVFDNSDCTTQFPAVDRQAAIIVNRILEQEAARGCRVDTDLTAFQTILWPDDRILDLPGRLALEVQPPAPAEAIRRFWCLDRVGADEPVFAAPDRNARVLGAWRAGGDLTIQHDITLEDGKLVSLYDIFFEDGAFADSRRWVYGRVENGGGEPAQVGWLFLPHAGYLTSTNAGGGCVRIAG